MSWTDRCCNVGYTIDEGKLMNSGCSICGSVDFSYSDVLWAALINTWELEPDEVDYINRQQGFHCNQCGNNLRSMALGAAIVNKYQFSGTLNDFVKSDVASRLKVLEINEAGGLTAVLSQLPGHLYVSYPEYDMTKLCFDAESFDLVIHSDTLEHVVDPMAGLSECKRVLKPAGACIFTIPIIIKRLSRSRLGLPPSYHGNETISENDLLVHTEFGADFWLYVLKAGFASCAVSSIEYPAGLAIVAQV
jgi:SAM-dependent methyltransferase